MTPAVIGGSGFHRWERFHHTETLSIATPYAAEPVSLFKGTLEGRAVIFLPRHGPEHSIPPHRINYRANIDALSRAGASAVLAIAAVGGITRAAAPGSLMVPDQVLDYTWGREHTFFDGGSGGVAHADMTEPYCEALRQELLGAAADTGVTVSPSGTYAATQGPRFETPAEVDRLERDGADIVGMTGMPEAVLAREARLAYAAVAIIVNPAAGRSQEAISMEEVRALLAGATSRVETLLARVLHRIEDSSFSVPAPMTP